MSKKRKSTDSLNDILQGLLNTILVEKPCKIIKVHNQYLVDVEYYDEYQKDILYKVPVKHLQTKNAYVFLGVKPGDCGTVRFFDKDISYYNKGSEDNGGDNRCHDINDGLFSLGFYPAPEQYIFPEGDVVIGTKNGALICVNSQNITISGGDVSITGSAVNIASNTVIDGINFLEHKHSNGNNGANTGNVVT